MTVTVPIAKVAKLNPPTPRELFDDPEREVSFVPMARLGEDGRLRNGEARPVGELLQGYTYFADGDVIVAKITPCLQNGKAAYVEKLKGGHGFGSTEFHVIRPSPALDGRYLFYMVWNPTFRHFGEQRFTGSAGQKRMPTSAVAEFQIPLPYPDDPKRSLAEQKRIAAILDKADDVRRRRHEAARLTGQLIPSLFYDMFGDPITNPHGYETAALGEIADMCSGGTPSKSVPVFWKGTVPWVSPKDMKRDELFDVTDHITMDAIEQTNLRILKPGSVLIVVRGMILAHTVPIAINRVPLTINQDMRAFVSRGRVSSEFLCWVLRAQHGRLLSLVSNAAHGTKRFESQDLNSVRVPVPSPKSQKEFCRRVAGSTTLQRHHEEMAEVADAMFNSLVQRAFRGEL